MTTTAEHFTPRSEWVSGHSGTIYVNPAHVSAVEETPSGTFLHLIGGQRIRLHDERSAQEIAASLIGPVNLD